MRLARRIFSVLLLTELELQGIHKPWRLHHHARQPLTPSGLSDNIIVKLCSGSNTYPGGNDHQPKNNQPFMTLLNGLAGLTNNQILFQL